MLVTPIKKGDIVDIIFPSTCCKEEEIAAIKNYVSNKLNLTARILLEKETTPEILAKIPTKIKGKENYDSGFPSYSTKARFQQLYQALTANSKIIWCARGGYGSGDLLPFLAKIPKIKQNKLFIGFSDITSIANFLQEKWGWQIIVAPMLLQLASNDIEKPAVAELKELIFGIKSNFNYDLIYLNKPLELATKTIKTEIIGGCLSVLTGHFGGNYQINFADKILFLEDTQESGERLDRYFRQIIEVILKTKKPPQAILLGNFLKDTNNIHSDPPNIRTAIKGLTDKIEQFNLKIPVLEVKDQNLGHSKAMRPLITGRQIELILDNKNSRFISNINLTHF